MHAEAAFTDHIAKIKRRVTVKAVHDLLLNAGLIFLGLLLILFLAATIGLTDAGMNGSWYAASIGISLSAAGFIGFLTRRNFLHVLVEIDRRFRLQDRLSTAYEYLKFKKDAEFSDLLMQDAAAAVQRLKRRQLLPAGFSWRHLIFLIFLLADAALVMMDYPTPRSDSARAEQETIEPPGALLRNYTSRRIENRAGPHTEPRVGLSRKLEQLADQLNDRSLTSDQRFTALTETLREVEAERNRLADELAAKLKAAGIRGLSARQIPAMEDLPPDQAAKLKELVNKALKSRIPDAVDKDIESLAELDSIAKILSRLVDDDRKDRSEAAESAASADEQIQTSQVPGGLDDERDDPRRPIPDGRTTGPDRSSPESIGEPGSGPLPKNEGGPRDGEGWNEGFSSSAGRAASEGEKKSSAEIEKSAGPALQDKMASSPVKSYLIHIRALTDTGEARLKDEDIRRAYGKAVESVLQKEDIPLNYREYIKNYFMAIGLNTEK
jgi:signal transduction histidine kinase